MQNFEGRNVVVTGGAGGIGEAAAAGFAEAGATVFILDWSQQALKAAKERLDPKGRIEAIQIDVGDRAAVAKAFETIAEAGGADVLVTSAAIVKTGRVLDFDLDDWTRILNVNLTGTSLAAQFAGRQMVAKGKGRIVTVSSLNGQIANTGRGAYSCTKGGVDMPTRLLANELGDKGITANAVAPTPVDTPRSFRCMARRTAPSGVPRSPRSAMPSPRRSPRRSSSSPRTRRPISTVTSSTSTAASWPPA